MFPYITSTLYIPLLKLTISTLLYILHNLDLVLARGGKRGPQCRKTGGARAPSSRIFLESQPHVGKYVLQHFYNKLKDTARIISDLNFAELRFLLHFAQ